MAFPSLATFLPRPVPDRDRHRPAQGQRQRHRRPALRARTTCAATPASRSSTWGSTLGAFIAPLVCGYLGQRVNWHIGFAAAGVGMVLGVIQYVARQPSISARPACYPAPAASPAGGGAGCGATRWSAAIVALAAIAGSALGAYTGVIPMTADADRRRRRLSCCSASSSSSSGGCSSSGNWTPEERKRLYVIGVLFLAAALFWSVFEQAGSTLNLFARSQHAQRRSSAGRFRAAGSSRCNSLFLIIFAPVFAWLWLRLARRRRNRRARRSSPSAWCWSAPASRS